MSKLKSRLVCPLTILAQLLVLFLAPVQTFATGASISLFSGEATKEFLSVEAPFVTQLEDNNLSGKIAIRAINPGYNIDAGKNAGELIELVNLTGSFEVDEESGEVVRSDFSEVALDNLAIIYTAKPGTGMTDGKSTVLYRFPEGSKMTGESVLLRYREAPEATEGSADLFYDTSIAMTGTVSLVLTTADFDASKVPDNSPVSAYGEVINSVCFLGGEGCLPIFSTTVKSRSYTTIVREMETGEYVHTNDYVARYDTNYAGLYLPPVENMLDGGSMADETNSGISSGGSQCVGLQFSEILSYYDAEPTEQFIELYNGSDAPMQLLGCQVKYKNKAYALVASEFTLPASEYYVMRPEFRLTKNPNTENTLELVDTDSTTIAKMSYPHGQKKSASYALMGYNADGTENWVITYAQTPGSANVYQEYKSCPAGKVINEATGNCVKAATVASTLADCPEGKYRNPATGRCKNIESDSTTAECKEGYERNPETNRCRKIKSNDGADYPVVPITGVTEQATFIALWAIGGIAAIGLGYVAFQFRKEILYFFRKMLAKVKR